jgi:molybdopterin converting factor small subunit
MTITIKIAQMLLQYTDNRETVEVEGSTVRECLENLVKRYPELRPWIFAPNEAPVITLLNNELVNSDHLDLKVNKNDKIALIPVVAGG